MAVFLASELDVKRWSDIIKGYAAALINRALHICWALVPYYPADLHVGSRRARNHTEVVHELLHTLTNLRAFSFPRCMR